MTAVTVDLRKIECGSCGGVYGITEGHFNWCRDRSKAWTCPYCKVGWGFDHDGSPLEKAKAEAKREKERAEREARRAAAAEGRAEREKRRRAAIKGQLTKTRKRVANGVCPCCNRTFQNLSRHMATQHPEYVDQEAEIDGRRVVHRGGPWFHIEDENGCEISGPVRGAAAARKLLAKDVHA